MNNIHDQVFFFCIIIYIIYNEEKRKVQTYRVAIKLSTMSATLLDLVSVFSFYAKNNNIHRMTPFDCLLTQGYDVYTGI